MHQPGNSNAENVERDHWRCEEAHVQDVGRRRKYGRDDKNNQN
jgi:hypothetical protein